MSIPGHLLLALAAVVVVGRLLGRVLGWFGQPPVMGDIAAGIVLGPSLLGLVAPAASFCVLPPPVAPYLSVVAQLGVIIYMFLVGLELNPGLIRGRMRSTMATALASVIVPFALGAALAVYLHPRLSTEAVPFAHFALFIGVALSITAFPVLARILDDRAMINTGLGIAALTCAAIADVVVWCARAPTAASRPALRPRRHDRRGPAREPTAGKFGGTFAAARLTGMGARHAAGLGVLMNTRGLMELIVLNIGLDLGVISPTLFTMLVIMALVTTLATTPIVQRLGPFRA